MITRAKLSSVVQGLPKYRSMLAGNTAYQPSGFYSIATLTAVGGESLLTFTGIPATYTHLHIRAVGSIQAGFNNNNNMFMKALNGDSGSNYSTHYYGTNSGSSTTYSASASDTSVYAPGDVWPSTTQTNQVGVAMWDILDYANTSKYKVVTSVGGMADGVNSYNFLRFNSAHWRNTAAISSISFEPQYTFAAGSIISLYGIK